MVDKELHKPLASTTRGRRQRRLAVFILEVNGTCEFLREISLSSKQCFHIIMRFPLSHGDVDDMMERSTVKTIDIGRGPV